MMQRFRADIIGAVLLVAVVAVPAQAQKKDKGNERNPRQSVVEQRGETRPELIRRSGDRFEVQERARGNGAGKVPPGVAIRL